MKKTFIFLSAIFFAFGSDFLQAESYPLLNAVSPIQYNQGTGALSILTASGTQAGALSAANWSVFNNKQSALTFGNLLTGTTGLSVTGGTGRLVGGNTTLTIQTASTSQPGLLSAADWATFNGKQAPITKGNLSTSTVGVAITGGTQSVIGSGATVNVQTASASQPGLLSAANWSTFNGKQSALTLGDLTSPTAAVSISGGTGAVVGSGVALSIVNANSSQGGLLSAADWTTFNNKQSTITSGDLSSPAPAISITGGTGSVLGTGTVINIANATASMTGLLSFLDWQAFNAKQNALSFGNLTTSTPAITITGGTGSVVGSGSTINIPTANGAQTGLLSAANWTTFSNAAPLNSPIFTGTPSFLNLAIRGSSAGQITISAPATVTSYPLKMPATTGSVGQTLILSNTSTGQLAWGAGGGGGAAVWGSITGTLSSQTDLQTALNAKAPIASPTFSGTVTGPNYVFAGSTSGTFTQSVPSTITSYSVTWPAAQGATSTMLSNNGSGALSWSPVMWGNIAGTLSTQTDLQSALNLKAPLASPTFTGTVTLPTASGVLHSSSGGVVSSSAVSLTADVTGNLPVANLNSGTSASSTTFWRGDGTWATPSGSSGVSIVGTFSGSSIANGASISGSTITFGPADATNPGMITTGTQTIKGAKTVSLDSNNFVTIDPSIQSMVLIQGNNNANNVLYEAYATSASTNEFSGYIFSTSEGRHVAGISVSGPNVTGGYPPHLQRFTSSLSNGMRFLTDDPTSGTKFDVWTNNSGTETSRFNVQASGAVQIIGSNNAGSPAIMTIDPFATSGNVINFQKVAGAAAINLGTNATNNYTTYYANNDLGNFFAFQNSGSAATFGITAADQGQIIGGGAGGIIIQSQGGTIKLATGSSIRATLGPIDLALATGIAYNRSTISNTDAAIPSASSIVGTSGYTGPHIQTLPLANAVAAGHTVILKDEDGSVSVTNTQSLTHAGSNTIDGGASVGCATAYCTLRVYSDGVSTWHAW